MKKKWDLHVRGKGHQVVVDAAEPGTDIIRVDGRLAARPLNADETQRAFIIDGMGYSLRRNGSRDFDLTPIGAGPTSRTNTIHIAEEDGEGVARWVRALGKLLTFGRGR